MKRIVLFLAIFFSSFFIVKAQNEFKLNTLSLSSGQGPLSSGLFFEANFTNVKKDLLYFYLGERDLCVAYLKKIGKINSGPSFEFYHNVPTLGLMTMFPIIGKEKLSNREKIIALHNKINNAVGTIFRQIACFNFEKELHETIRKEGYCSKEKMANIMNKHMKSYLGPVVDLKEEDGYFFANWSHIRRFFYVYSYAYGHLISSALYSQYKKDKSFKNKIEQFLKAGGSKSSEDIFVDIGVDIRNPKFFENGVKEIEEDIKRLEKLVK